MMKNDLLDSRALTQIVDLFEKQFGSNCEVVLHDLSRPYDSTIVDIRNGHVSGRRVGDCGSNLGLEVIRGTVKDGDKFNYFTNTKDGKILRSSSIYLKDDKGDVRFSLCVNVDITESVKFENFLSNQNRYDLVADTADEILVSSVSDLLEHMIERGIQHIGKQPSEMSKEEKMRFIQFMDQKGVFKITKSGEQICSILGITRYAFYNILETVRKSNDTADFEPAV